MSEYRDKLLTIGVVRPAVKVREYRDDGEHVRQVTDEHGNITTSRFSAGTERVGVEIRPQTVTLADGRTLKHHEKGQ